MRHPKSMTQLVKDHPHILQSKNEPGAASSKTKNDVCRSVWSFKIFSILHLLHLAFVCKLKETQIFVSEKVPPGHRTPSSPGCHGRRWQDNQWGLKSQRPNTRRCCKCFFVLKNHVKKIKNKCVSWVSWLQVIQSQTNYTAKSLNTWGKKGRPLPSAKDTETTGYSRCRFKKRQQRDCIHPFCLPLAQALSLSSQTPWNISHHRCNQTNKTFRLTASCEAGVTGPWVLLGYHDLVG